MRGHVGIQEKGYVMVDPQQDWSLQEQGKNVG
jgi:hypothetical protein